MAIEQNKEILDFATFENFPSVGTLDTLYLDRSNGKVYSWQGDSYVFYAFEKENQIVSINGLTGVVVIDFNQNNTFMDLNSLDAAGSLSVSNKTIIGSYVQDKHNLPLLLNRINSGTASQSWSEGVVEMSVGVGEYAICQSYQRHFYLAGKSQNIEITFSNFQNEIGLQKRVGYFSSSITAPFDTVLDGFFLQSDATGVSLNLYKNGTLIESVNQSAWNDPMNGTGPSEQTIDFSKFTVANFDFLYPGGTALRLFFNIGGVKYLAHTIKNSNVNNSTFIGSPAQPVRWEIRSTTAAGSLNQVCASVTSSFSVDIIGHPLSIDTGSSYINANNPAENYLIAALRISDLKEIVFDFKGSALASTNDGYITRFILNPTFAAAPSWNPISGTGIEFALGEGSNPSTTTVTGGTVLKSDFISSDINQGNFFLDFSTAIGSSIDGVSDVIALCVQPTSLNLDIRGSINFKNL